MKVTFSFNTMAKLSSLVSSLEQVVNVFKPDSILVSKGETPVEQWDRLKTTNWLKDEGFVVCVRDVESQQVHVNFDEQFIEEYLDIISRYTETVILVGVPAMELAKQRMESLFKRFQRPELDSETSES